MSHGPRSSLQESGRRLRISRDMWHIPGVECFVRRFELSWRVLSKMSRDVIERSHSSQPLDHHDIVCMCDQTYCRYHLKVSHDSSETIIVPLASQNIGLGAIIKLLNTHRRSIMRECERLKIRSKIFMTSAYAYFLHFAGISRFVVISNHP